MSFDPVKVAGVTPLHDDVIVSDMEFAERRTRAGLIIPGDDGKPQGVHPRWGRVYAVGPKQKDVAVGQWVCVAHGRWTRGITVEDANGKHTIRKIDVDDILLVSDEQPVDENMGQGL